jgi:hypothetical protein
MARPLLALVAGCLLGAGTITPVGGVATAATTGGAATAAAAAAAAADATAAPAVLLDDFLGGLIADLKAELIVAQAGPPATSVPEFKLSPWGPEPGASPVNRSFASNPSLLAARALITAQAREVRALRENATERTAQLSAALAGIREMEAELARVTAEIKASEAREVAVQQHAVEKAQAAEKAKAKAEEGTAAQEKKHMQQLEAKAQREVAAEATEYNDALHHVLANAGAVLHQQEHVLQEKKTVLQEAADRAELPEVVDFVGGKVSGMAAQAKNISASQRGVRTRLAELQEDIKETMALIARLEGGDGGEQGGGSSNNATATSNATGGATAVRE